MFRVPGRPGVQRLTIAVAVMATVMNLAYVASLGFDRPPSGYSTLWDGWVAHLGGAVLVVLVVIRAATDRRNRLAWGLVAADQLLTLVGDLTYLLHDQNLDPEPFPAVSDALYIAGYVALIVALIVVTQRHVPDVSRSVRLDGLIVGLAAGSVAILLWFGSILEQSGSFAEVAVGMAYPVFDVVLIVVIVAGLAPARFRLTWSAGIFLVGAAVLTVGDVVYLRQLSTDSYVPATMLEATWVLGAMLFAFGPWAPDNHVRRSSQAQVAGSTTLPTIASVLALFVVSCSVFRPVQPLAMWLAIGALAIVLVRVGSTVRELRLANEAFRQARTDELTGLLNRRGFAELLDERLRDTGRGVSVMVIDLNGFKEVNDSLGHHAGDQLLVVVGKRFAAALPAGSLVGRLGGDEFGIATDRLGADASDTATRLLATLDNPIALDDIAVRVGAAIGIAESPDHGTTRAELLRAADVAMYTAKTSHQGVNRYCADHDPHSRDRLALIDELHMAIEHRAFEMHYQPTVDVATGRIVGMEALIRWDHPTRGLLSPAEFIPLAERIGLIPAITRAVLDLSIAHLAEVRRAGHELRLSVNISAKDLVDDALPDYVRSTLRAHDVPPDQLTLEITETAITLDTVRAERVLNSLRADGIRISIDDFGVGYSSMSQLLELPLDELKLDRSFVANLHDDVRAQAILSATVELGRRLGLDIVAEGVETSGALDEVADRGVETAQGHLFSPALPPLAFGEFLEATRQRVQTTAAGDRPGG